MRVQVAVVGAGPAGARAAELLATAGADVLLLDPRAPWEKPCGGGLTPPVFQSFPELNELLPETREARKIRVEAGPTRSFEILLKTPLRIISRQRLARWQLERATERGAIHIPEKVRSVRRSGKGWLLEAGARTIRADYVVGADGAASLVRSCLAPDLCVERAPTRVAYVGGAAPTQVALRFTPDLVGYTWVFPRPDHATAGIALWSGRWTRSQMDEAVDDRLRSLGAEPGAGVVRAGAVIGTAQLGHGSFRGVADEGFALLGDAAGYADPATGEGIHNALRSAELLTEAWAADGTFRRYPELARRAFEREFRVGRRVRRVQRRSAAVARLVGAGTHSRSAAALVAAAVNAANDHDATIGSILLRWLRALVPGPFRA